MSDTPSFHDDQHLVFAELIPANRDAERCLDQLVSVSNLTEYHRGFIQVNRASTRVIQTSHGSGSEVTGDESSKSSFSAADTWVGCYSFSWQQLEHKHGARGWRLGRGASKLPDRGVDLLLISPGKKSRDVATVHALIQLHPKSGCLMLTGVVDNRPVECESNGEIRSLGKNEKQVLDQKVTRFRLGRLEYKFEYKILSEFEHTQFKVQRQRALNVLDLPDPHPKLSLIPQSFHTRINTIAIHGTISSGAFGWVSAGVDSLSGTPLAVKALFLTNSCQIGLVENEIEISTSFPQSVGLLQAQKVFCEHYQPRPCGTVPEQVYLTFPLAYEDLSRQVWPENPTALLVKLIRGPVEGLSTLHRAGYIHRDVTAKNILVLSLDPPQATLCDYGKAVRATSHVDSRIGPIPTLAPEVDGRTEYSNKIDVWSLAYACCSILFPATRRAQGGSLMSEGTYRGLIDALNEYSNRGPLENSFADLLRQMLSLRPEDRISSAQALLHRCFVISQSEASENDQAAQLQRSQGSGILATASPYLNEAPLGSSTVDRGISPAAKRPHRESIGALAPPPTVPRPVQKAVHQSPQPVSHSRPAGHDTLRGLQAQQSLPRSSHQQAYQNPPARQSVPQVVPQSAYPSVQSNLPRPSHQAYQMSLTGQSVPQAGQQPAYTSAQSSLSRSSHQQAHGNPPARQSVPPAVQQPTYTSVQSGLQRSSHQAAQMPPVRRSVPQATQQSTSTSSQSGETSSSSDQPTGAAMWAWQERRQRERAARNRLPSNSSDTPEGYMPVR